MASLNTLRTRGGVIVTAVIGIALLAFVLGDFTPSSCSQHYVGEIAGNKIDYMEYAQNSENYTLIYQLMSQKEALSTEESDQARDMAWEAMIMDYSFMPGFEKLGLTVSDAEEADMGGGVYISPVIESMFANPQTGMYDPAELRRFHQQVSTDPSGRTMVMWNYIKRQMNEQRIMAKYMSLISSAMCVTDIEVEEGVQATNNKFNAQIVSLPYSQVPDSVVKITNGDIKEYYSKHKDSFIRDASRDIEYVMFDLLPSEADYKESEKNIQSLADEFAISETPMNYATLNSEVRPSQRFLKESQISDAAIAAAVWDKPEAMYGPKLSGDVYTIARLGEVKMMPDSLGASNIVLTNENMELVDSIADALKKGANFAELAVQFSLDQNAAMNGGDMGVFSPEEMQQYLPALTDALLSANTGEVVTVKDGELVHIAKLTHKSPLVKKAQVAIIKYNVEPSTETRNKIFNDARDFQADATGSYDKFKKAVSDNALVKKVAHISNRDRNVYGIEDSRELVRWAFTSKNGSISDIMEMGGHYVIAALTRSQESGQATVDEAANEIRPIVMRQKKAAILEEKLSGATISEVAQSAGVEVVTAEEVGFDTFQIDNIGVEQQLVGAICATTDANKLSNSVKGNLGIYKFAVTDIITSDDATADSERVKAESMFSGYVIGQRVGQALSDTADVTDNRVKYF